MAEGVEQETRLEDGSGARLRHQGETLIQRRNGRLRRIVAAGVFLTIEQEDSCCVRRGLVPCDGSSAVAECVDRHGGHEGKATMGYQGVVFTQSCPKAAH